MNAYISVTNYQACIIHTYIIDKRINLTRKHRIKYETVKKTHTRTTETESYKTNFGETQHKVNLYAKSKCCLMKMKI